MRQLVTVKSLNSGFLSANALLGNLVLWTGWFLRRLLYGRCFPAA